MTKAATKPKETETIKQLAKDLLTDVPGALADLYREGGGFTVSVLFLPDIKEPTEAHISVQDGEGAKIDTFTVPANKAYEAFNHTTQFSDPLLIYLSPQHGAEKEKKKGK